MVIAKKKWGQHWLANDALAETLATAVSVRPGETFLEIGPGTGRLTGALLRHQARVVAVEVDPECCEELRQRYAGAALTLIQGDALAIDVELPWQTNPLRLIGNLPYNLSGPFLRWTATHRTDIVDAHYMLQREVADRAASAPGTKSYGVLSVRTQWEFEVNVVKRLTAGSFRPMPKVDSAFVRLTPRPLSGGTETIGARDANAASGVRASPQNTREWAGARRLERRGGRRGMPPDQPTQRCAR